VERITAREAEAEAEHGWASRAGEVWECVSLHVQRAPLAEKPLLHSAPAVAAVAAEKVPVVAALLRIHALAVTA
jgi:hypothetical protein